MESKDGNRTFTDTTHVVTKSEGKYTMYIGTYDEELVYALLYILKAREDLDKAYKKTPIVKKISDKKPVIKKL